MAAVPGAVWNSVLGLCLALWFLGQGLPPVRGKPMQIRQMHSLKTLYCHLLERGYNMQISCLTHRSV